jgi:hypothetical protein
MGTKFNNYDRVKRKGLHEMRTVQEIRPGADGETSYLIQLDSDAAAREWAKESELELAAPAPKTDSGHGFYPARSITD